MTATDPTSSAALPVRRIPSEIGLGVLVVAVIVMMALPLPAWSLDILVAVNISLGVVLLLVALFIPTPLAFSTFPSVLLITTLFRISLNVATTRQILLHAHAGDIIDAFGRMVVGGSLVVGLVVFLIITIVQFIVVAKGAERVAEVSARFTLDALPGKQMAIDADLRAGLIGQNEAIEQRRSLVQESQFYGAMDGAMKFVKGDAIAGIVIVLVNLLGGIAIGTLVMDLGFAAATQKFSVLSIGDGLVTQIPALFVSIAAGIAITRTSSDGSSNLGEQIATQLSGQPRALMLSSVVLVLFALVPGFPTFTFLLLAAAVAALGSAVARRARGAKASDEAEQVPSASREGEKLPETLRPGPGRVRRPPLPFRLEFATDLAAALGARGLDAALAAERSALRERYGLPFPGVALRVRADLPPRHCVIVVQDLPESRFVVPAGVALALGAARTGAAEGAATQAPATAAAGTGAGTGAEGAGQPAGAASEVPALLQPARWVTADAARGLRGQGIEVLEPAQAVARALVVAIQRNAPLAVGLQEVRAMVREIEGRYGDLVRESQGVLPLPRLAELMAALARERVPLGDMAGLMQAVLSSAPGAADPHALYEGVRKGLARSIVARLIDEGQRTLPVAVLETSLEDQLRSALAARPDGPVIALEPASIEMLSRAVQRVAQPAEGNPPSALLLPPDLRRALSRLFRTVVPRLAFLSTEELAATGLQHEVVGTVKLEAQSA